MAWRFWEKKSAPKSPTLETFDWPAGAHDSVVLLVGMFLQQLKPFSDWRDPEAKLPAELEDLTKFSAWGYQLALWFIMLHKDHGTVAAQMTQHAFVALLGKAQPEGSKELERLLLFATDILSECAQRQGRVTVNGEVMEIPLAYASGVCFLTRTRNSPFYGQHDPDFKGADIEVAKCLNYANQAALKVFVPMHKALTEFSARAFAEWEWRWSESPGAFERQLRRRHQNPLFAPERQQVTAEDVYQARLEDAAYLDRVREEVVAIVAINVTNPAEVPTNVAAYFNGIRDKIDTALEHTAAGRPSTQALHDRLLTKRNALLELWRSGLLADDPTMRQELDTLEAANAAYFKSFHGPTFCADVSHPGHPITDAEFMPTLLCEDVSDLMQIWESDFFTNESKEKRRQQAVQLVRQAVQRGVPASPYIAKLRVLGVEL